MKPASARKIATVDTVANVTYSLAVGTALDYWSGLRGWGIVASRSYATIFNGLTGGIYGLWREKVNKITGTDESSPWYRKAFTELFAMEIFAVPSYASFVAFGSLVSEGQINWELVRNGAWHVVLAAPFIGPTYGWYNDWMRSLFGVESAAEGAYGRQNAGNPETKELDIEDLEL